MSESSIRAFRDRWRREALLRNVNPRDVDLLLGDALQKPLTWLIAHDDEPLLAPVRQSVVDALQRRFDGEPLQYIRGRADFYASEFLVDARVLIPRPETELVVEEVLRRAFAGDRVIDIGAGSGCIDVSIKCEMPSLRVFATDVSIDALALARTNARRLGANVHFAASDVLHAIRGTFRFVVSNPPYIPAADVATLATEVRGHEPLNALTPGPIGDEIIRRLFDESRSLLAPDGFLIFEIGFGQSDVVRERADEYGWEVVEIVNDLAAIPRVVVAQRALESRA